MGMKKKSDIAKDFGIPRNTLSTYLKNKEKILRSESECDKGRKRLREPGNPDLDKCVLKWFKQARDKKIPVSGHLIRSKAEQFATEMGKTDFKASSGWLDGFKERNKISFKTICGESGAVNLQVAEQWKNNLRELIQDKDGEITDADIIAEVLNHNIEKQDGDEASGDEDESSVAGEMNVPSAAEATNYIMQLRRFFESKNDVVIIRFFTCLSSPEFKPTMRMNSTLKRDRDGEFPEIEEALFRWIRQANAMKLAINGNILKEKAILLALKMGQDNFEASNGWLEKLKARRNIAFKRLHGEAGSVDANSVATWKGFVMDEAMEEVVEEEMNRCFEALKKHQAIDVDYIDFLEVDKDVQVAGEQSIEEIVKEVMGKEEDEEVEPTEKDLNKTSITPAAAVDAFNTIKTLCYLKDISEEERHACLLKIDYLEYILNRISEKKQTSIKYFFFKS
ncbi:hypothetical protein LAZ67_22000657 [Cordylochernes scorpioides]|uniref:HTH CENPB-type domain-containing protein n=1 Tax=Cordylochernes scorpioides TaxID=51811 RepID=A0ABY6LNF8_9ARAC|nr:hypothetical protein LAZ67_22000657 [Cordylochernes scorpioides]